jgi:hypothetical protein
MSSLQDELSRIESELRAAKMVLARDEARVRGLEAEREALASSLDAMTNELQAPAEDLSRSRKDEAIVAVLQAAPGPMRIPEIVEALHRAGRPDESYNVVAIYLNGLVKKERVRRVRRGEYEPC